MSLQVITVPQARLIHLHAQRLLTTPSAPSTKADVLNAIRRMRLLQIDTIHVVARSPYFVLFSRLGDYDPDWLDELLVEKQVFEQWAHAACYIPIEDYPLIRRLILEGMRESFFDGWIDDHRGGVDQVLEHVRANGPVKSADFKSEKEPGGWWNWKIEKAALEYWFSRGDLMVVRRENFQRVYDLAEHVLPDWDDAHAPPLAEVYRALILKSISALGVARPEWVADYYRLPKRTIAGLLPGMVEDGSLRQVGVEGWEQPALYVPADEGLIESALREKLHAEYTTLLSPFDPVTWDRNRARQLFDFDFMIQAYTKAENRVYGYFPLPVLHNGELVGRVDAKVHRKEGVFEVKGLFMEDRIKPDEQMIRDLARALQRCADWHKTPQVRIGKVFPDEFMDSFVDHFPMGQPRGDR